MAINEWKIWRKFGLKKISPDEKVNPTQDIEAIVEFLNDVGSDVKALLPQLNKLKKLEEEISVANQGLLQTNLEAQNEVLTKLLQYYQSLQDDCDINGIRLKRIAKEHLKNCQKEGLKDLVKKKKADHTWNFFW